MKAIKQRPKRNKPKLKKDHYVCVSLSHVQLFVIPWTVCSPPVSSVHEILQVRIWEWFAMPTSRGSSQPEDQTQVSRNVGGFCLNHQGCPWILEWVAYPFSRGIFPTQESNYTAGGFFTSWVTRETQGLLWVSLSTEGCHTLDLQNWRRKAGVTFMYIMSLKWRRANRFEYQLCHTTELALGSILHYS